jgi:hypothetical protein
MNKTMKGHVASDRIGEAAQHGTLDYLREPERLHVADCVKCQQLFAGYRMADRLLAAPWRQTTMPPAALAANTARGGLAGLLDGLADRVNPRSLAPMGLVLALVALVGAGFLLPQLLPQTPVAQSHSPIASTPTATSQSTDVGLIANTPAASPSPTGKGTEPGGQSTAGPTQAPPAGTPGPVGPEKLASLPGWPVAWSPDGAHLLVVRGGYGAQQFQIRDAAGRLTGTVSAESATWVDSRSIAILTQTQGFGQGGTVSIVDTAGHLKGTLPGKYADSGGRFGSSGGFLVGSGTGELAIANESGRQSGWSFVVWDGTAIGAPKAGVPLAFSADGSKIAILHPSGGPGGQGGAGGSLEIAAAGTLRTLASFPRTSLRVEMESGGNGFGPDATFSPSGAYLLASGTLVDLSSGATVQAGDGGWLPDGTLLTSSGGAILRWHGMHSSPDSRFAAGGSIATSRHGEAVEFFNNNHTPLLMTTDGAVHSLILPGVSRIGDLLISPTGRVAAIDGSGPNGSPVAGLASLR